MTNIIKLTFSALALALTIFTIAYWLERIYTTKTTKQADIPIIELYHQKLGKLYYGMLLATFISLFINSLVLFSNFYDYPINEGWKVANSIFAWLIILVVSLINWYYKKLAKQEWEANNKKKTDHD